MPEPLRTYLSGSLRRGRAASALGDLPGLFASQLRSRTLLAAASDAFTRFLPWPPFYI
jgi:hypothetical protein